MRGAVKACLSGWNRTVAGRWRRNLCDIFEVRIPGIDDEISNAVGSRYIDSREGYHELLSLKLKDELLRLCRSSARSVGVDKNSNAAPNVGESYVGHSPADVDDWNRKGAVGQDEENALTSNNDIMILMSHIALSVGSCQAVSQMQ